METRTPGILSQVFHALGLGAKIPRPSGPVPIRSLHFRIAGGDGVLVQCFFPISPPPVSTPETAITAPSSPWIRTYRNGVIKGMSNFASLPHFLFDIILGASQHPLHSPDLLNWIPSSQKYPVILFSHGLGGNAEIYTKRCSDWASHGYLVIAIEHEDGSGSHAKTSAGQVISYIRPPPAMPYTRVEVISFRTPFLEKRRQEVKQVLSFLLSQDSQNHAVLQMANRELICLAGHSFGAASTVFVAQKEEKSCFKGALLLDLWSFPLADVQQGVPVPGVCSILSEPFAASPDVTYTKQLLKATANGHVASFYLPGSVHQSFSDTPWWLPQFVGRRFAMVGNQDADAIQAAILQVELAFFQEIFSVSSPSMENLESHVLSTNSRMKRFLYL